MPDLPAVAPGVSTLFFGGISLVCEPAADAYCTLAERESSDKVIMLDPNIRVGFIEDADRYRARLSRMMACADIMKVSDEDLDWLCPGGQDLQDKATALQLETGCILLVTRGKHGVSAWLPNGGVVHVPSRAVEVVDTIGAGDTFNAGVLAHLSKVGMLSRPQLATICENRVHAALAFAVTVASVTVSRAGANPPWRHEVV